MAGDVKRRMAAGAAQLLAQQGLQGTSFAEVLELTGAPRGSVYHHFPEGKNQLVAAALDVAGERALTLLESWRGRDAREVAAAFINVWREILTRSDFQAGCAVVAVTVATDSEDLLERAAGIFRAWRATLADLLGAGGHPDPEGYAALLVAACEGAVVMSRAAQSLEPFEKVAGQLLAQLIPRAAPPGYRRARTPPPGAPR